MSPNFYHVIHAYCFLPLRSFAMSGRVRKSEEEKIPFGLGWAHSALLYKIECHEIWRSIWKYVNLLYIFNVKIHSERSDDEWMPRKMWRPRMFLFLEWWFVFLFWGPTYANKKSIMKFTKAVAYDVWCVWPRLLAFFLCEELVWNGCSLAKFNLNVQKYLRSENSAYSQNQALPFDSQVILHSSKFSSFHLPTREKPKIAKFIHRILSRTTLLSSARMVNFNAAAAATAAVIVWGSMHCQTNVLCIIALYSIRQMQINYA